MVFRTINTSIKRKKRRFNLNIWIIMVIAAIVLAGVFKFFYGMHNMLMAVLMILAETYPNSENVRIMMEDE